MLGNPVWHIISSSKNFKTVFTTKNHCSGKEKVNYICIHQYTWRHKYLLRFETELVLDSEAELRVNSLAISLSDLWGTCRIFAYK